MLQDRIKEDWKGYTLPGDLRSSEEGTMHWIDEKDLSQANLVEDFGDLIEVMLNNALTEFQYVIEDGKWIVVKK